MPDGPAQGDLIVRTKLYRPRLTTDMVVRDRLLDLLDRAAGAPLILVSAPAGYGKSVLVSQWIERSGPPVAWVSLDREDSELPAFLAYIVAALNAVVPGAGSATADLLDAPALPPVPTVCDLLLNDLDALDTSCVLVLDDYHRIDAASPVHDILNRLLEHPPAQVRCVLMTRQDPPLALTRPRAEGRVAEVRLQDLRFTGPETTEFLAAAAEIAVGEEALANLQHEVEGWAVGLRLVTLALRHAADPDVFLRSMRGGLVLTREYLLQEVLGSLSPAVRRFLLASSVLDRFCADLLDVLADTAADDTESGPSAREFLQELQKDNLFTIALDVRGEWFRYHHLFQEMLVQELTRLQGPQEVRALHGRVSRWFEEKGYIDEALHHATAADDITRAARIVVQHRRDAINEDRWYVLDKWLAFLPESIVQTRAELLVTRAWFLLHHFRFEVVLPIADQVEALLADTADPEPLRGEIELFRGYILYFLGDGAGSLQHIEAALARIPESFYEARAQCEVIHALSSQMVGSKERALRGLDDLLARYQSPEELRKTRLVITYVFIHVLEGDLAAAEAANRRLLEIVERGGYAYGRAWTAHMQGLIHLQRFELGAAVEHLSHSVAQRFIHFKRAATDSITGLMLAQQALGRPEEARTTLGLLQSYVAGLDDPVLWTLVGSAEARLEIMAGRPEIAVKWCAAVDLPPEVAMLWWLEVPSVTRCRALIAAGSAADLAEAEERLVELTGVSEAHHNTGHLIEILVLRAVVCEGLGKGDEARDLCTRALELARPGGIIFPFLEVGPAVSKLLRALIPAVATDAFIERILAAIVSAAGRAPALAAAAAGPSSPAIAPRPMAVEGLLEDLTGRELEVLRLLPKRLQDKEIADKLEISSHTVRHHLKQIYQKLDVHNRRQAGQRAAELGLLGDNSSG